MKNLLNEDIFMAKIKTNVENFTTITQKMADTYKKKNADYGDSFSNTCDEFGITAAIVRMSDKFLRIKQLAKNTAQVKDEKIEDTLLDLANYAIMTLIWLQNKK